MHIDLNKIKYSNNFLSNVIFRIDYNPILVLREKISPQFHESIRIQMPVLQEEKGFEYRAEIKDGTPQGSIAAPITSWIILDKSERFKLTLNYSFLAIEDFHYTSLEEYLERIQIIVQAFASAYPKPDYTRIGLRYINTINLKDGNPLDWAEYISDFLTCSNSGFGENIQYLSRTMGQYALNKDEYQIVCNYGIFNPEFPAKITRRQYILDYDCYSQDVSSDIPAQVRKFNRSIQELFENSIKEPLRTLMGVTNAGKD